MAQVQVSTLLAPIAQITRGCPTTTMVDAYIRAVRRFCNRSRWFKSTLLGATTAPTTSDYTTGTVTVTSGSATVSGSGTAWLANVRAGDFFTGPDDETMEIQGVQADTGLTLFEVYAGSTLAGQAYTITRDRGVAIYSLGSDTYHEICGISAVSVVDTNGKANPLTPRASTEWDSDLDRAIPELYEYIPHAQLALHPTPDAIYTMAIGLILQPKLGSNSIDDSLLVDWSDDFNRGALAYLLDLHGMAWTDKSEAERMRLRFESAIDSAASAVAANYNAGALPAGEFGPRTAIARTGMQVI